jgi:ATP-binding cassette, subfamily B, multidrug efflux pump
MKSLKSLLKHFKKYIIFYTIGFIALFAVDLLQIFIPKIIGDVFDRLKSQSIDLNGVILQAFYVLIVGFLVFLGRITWRLCIFGSSRKIEYDLRNDLFSHLEKLSLNFYNKNKTGDLMSYFTNDLAAVRQAIGPGLMMALDGIIMTLFVIVSMMYFVNVQLTLIAIIPLPIISIGGILFGKSLTMRFKDKQEAYSKLSDYVQESFTGIRVIKAFVQEPKEIKAFLEVNNFNMDKNVKLIKLYGILFPIVEIISGISFLITLLYGGYLAMIGRISLGQYVMFNEFIGMLVWPMVAIGWCINIFSQGYASQVRVQNIFDEKPDIFDGENVKAKPFSNTNIEIKNLNFKYNGVDEPVLKNINLTIEEGKTLAIVGKTGSGKTTLVNLLLRLYNPPEKSIFFSGTDIYGIPLKNLRRHIGIVPQDNFLFSDTVTGNVGLGMNELIFDEVVEAAKDANVYSNIVDFPDRFETVVGERGITLSGGQKQRISIARVLIKKPEILILDDSFSSVDTHTEETILKNIYNIRKNKTTIIIAHRISTVKQADKIIVLDNGSLVESGTHEELIENNGYYSKMYERQQLEKVIEES